MKKKRNRKGNIYRKIHNWIEEYANRSYCVRVVDEAPKCRFKILFVNFLGVDIEHLSYDEIYLMKAGNKMEKKFFVWLNEGEYPYSNNEKTFLERLEMYLDLGIKSKIFKKSGIKISNRFDYIQGIIKNLELGGRL